MASALGGLQGGGLPTKGLSNGFGGVGETAGGATGALGGAGDLGGAGAGALGGAGDLAGKGGPLGGLGLAQLLDLNLENPETLLAVGDEEEKAAVGLLARKKLDNDRKQQNLPPVTDQELQQNPGLLSGALVGLDLNNKEQLLAIGDEEGKGAIELLSKKKAEKVEAQKVEAQQGGCPPSEGLFYAYAIQSGNPQAPRYAITFDNPATADDYAKQLAKDYPQAKSRQSAQFFVFPPNVDPNVLATHPNYAPFVDKMFLTPTSGIAGGPPHAILPPMDRKGYTYSTCCNCNSQNTGGQYPPSQGGQYPPPQGSQYPPQHGGQYPPQQGIQNPPQQGGQYPPQQGGQYPPQQGGQYPPQQGNQYPPQQGGQYPPQQGNQYPPQQGGKYPPQHGGQCPPQQGSQYPPQQGSQYPPPQRQNPPLQGGQYPPQQTDKTPQQGAQYPSTQRLQNPPTQGGPCPTCHGQQYYTQGTAMPTAA